MRTQPTRQKEVERAKLTHGLLMIGSLVGGHVRILGALGQGGMGNVYLGVDERLGREVAVKTIRADRSAETRERFLREARALSALDHPNICRIFEYIESPDGDFLVLERIDGMTLARAIENGMSRQRKLRIAADILAALVAAHRKGIVHRDLKPDNVMIASDGTVKVLDFGIAHLEAAGEPSSPNVAAVAADDDATLVYPINGATLRLAPRIIIGTPIYMSPEQAAGGEVSTASDLYSFGLLLQALLTEEPPRDRTLGREELLRRSARGESLPLLGQSRDVTTLVAALKDPLPAKRPTAPEALASVQRILDAPKRRMRVIAAVLALAIVLGGAAKYAFDIMAARREAERRRAQAEELVRFVVGDLRRKLEPVGRLDVLDSAASHALAYFASLSPDEMTGDDLNHNALALAQLGQARDKEGKLAQAIDLFRQSLRFASAAVHRDDTRDDWQLTLSNAYFYLGDALRRKNDPRGTLENFQAYFTISQRLAQRHPNDPKYQAEVSYAHGNLGAAYEAAGDLPRALSEYRTTCTLDRERSRREPGNEQWQSDLANSANRLGVVLQKSGDFTGARAAFDEDLALRRRLAQAAPNDARRQQRLEVSLAFAGALRQATGDVAGALTCYREETALASLLAERDSSNTEARRNQAAAQARLASLLPPSEGQPLVERAANELRALVAIEARTSWRRDLATTLVRLAAISLARNDLPRARRAVEEALPLSEALYAARPSDTQYIRLLCDTLLAEAAIDEKSGRTALALQRRTRAAEIAHRAEHDPARPVP